MCAALKKQQHSETPCWTQPMLFLGPFSTEILISSGRTTFLIAKAQRFEPPGNWKNKLNITICCLMSQGYCWTFIGYGPLLAWALQAMTHTHICARVNEVPDNTEMRSRTECQTQFPITLWSTEKSFASTNHHAKYILWCWSVREISHSGNRDQASMLEVSKAHPITSS